MLDKTVTDWREAASGLVFEGRAFINGRHTEALSGATRPTLNPANGLDKSIHAFHDYTELKTTWIEFE